MPTFFDVRITGFNEFSDYLQKLDVKVPKATDRDLGMMGRDFRYGLLMALRSSGITKFDGALEDSIEVRKNSENEWEITMAMHGRYLDSMPIHRVVVKGKPQLERWARQKLGEVPYSMVVKPTPWIASGLREGGNRAVRTLKNGEIVRVFKGGLIT